MFFYKKIKEQEPDIFEKIIKTQDVQGMYDTISRLPNPDIILRKTGKGLDTLRNLTNHYQVGPCIDSRKAGVTSKLFTLQKGNTPDSHFKLYQDIFNNVDIYGLIESILDAPLFGFVPIEINWTKDGNYIIPAKFEAEPQEWFHFNREGDFFFKHKDYQPTGLLIKPESRKFLLPKNKPTRKNPYGQCILSRCFWNVAFINGGMEFWVKMTEKYGMPFMVGKYDRSMNQAEKDNLLAALINMIQDAVGVIPADGSVEIIEAGGKGASADIYEKLITKCENNISKSILGQTLTTDVGNHGSYAAANVHNNVRIDIVNSDKRLCENTINTAIQYINEINFNDKDCPKCSIYDEKSIDQSVAERDNKIYNTGVRFTKSYMMKTHGYTEDDIVMVEESAQPYTNNFSDTVSDIAEPIETNNLLDIFTPEDFQKLVTPAMKPIVEFFNKSRDAEEAMEKLAEVYPQMNTEELEKNLTKVIFISEILGRAK